MVGQAPSEREFQSLGIHTHTCPGLPLALIGSFGMSRFVKGPSTGPLAGG
jgi:hypothetical protein